MTSQRLPLLLLVTFALLAIGPITPAAAQQPTINAMAILGNHAYVGIDSNLYVLNVVEPTQPTLINIVQFPTTIVDVQADDSLVYVAAIISGGYRIYLIDVAAPTAPVVTSSYTCQDEVDFPCQSITRLRPGRLPNGHRALYLVSGIPALSITSSLAELRILDVADPARPVAIGTRVLNSYALATSGQVRSLEQVGNYVYLFMSYVAPIHISSELIIVDISDPTNPKTLAPVYVNAGLTGLIGTGRYRYALGEKLQVLDLAQPAQPVLVGAYPLLSNGPQRFMAPIPKGVLDYTALSGNTLYASFKGTSPLTQELHLIDVSQPPTMTTYTVMQVPLSIPLPTSGQMLSTLHAVASGYLYSPILNTNTLRIIDVRQPNAPKIVGTYNVPAGNTALQVTGRVLQANGRPLPGVTLTLQGQQAQSDAAGTYTFTGLLSGTATLTPSLTDTTFVPPTRSLPLGSVAITRVPDIVALARPISTTVEANAAASLTMTDTQGLPTQIELPAGAIGIPATLHLTPTLTPGAQDNLVFAGHSFELSLTHTVAGVGDLRPSAPLWVQIGYSDADVAGLNEGQLALSWWNGRAWVDTSVGCGTPLAAYERNTTGNTLGAPLCRVGRYSLVGTASRVRLPLMVRS